MAKYTPTDIAKRVPRLLKIEGVDTAWGGDFRRKSSNGEVETIKETKPNDATDAYFDKHRKATIGKKPIAQSDSNESISESAIDKRKREIFALEPDAFKTLAQKNGVAISSSDKKKDIVAAIIKAEK